MNNRDARNNRPTTKQSGSSSEGENLWVSLFHVPKMDCPSEERLIRMALEGSEQVRSLSFELKERRLRVVHKGESAPILDRLVPLNLGASLQNTEAASPDELAAGPETAVEEARTLKLLLAINGLMFVIELAVGWWAQSTGLIADSLDMFADAAVYGLALYAVGQAASAQLRAARFAGWIQMLLAVGVLVEVVRRFAFGSEPQSSLMMAVASVALIANIACLVLISRNRHGGVHMKASWIFSANDVIANTGVILAGLLVYWTGSPYPDLIVGLVIGLVVLNGARRILALRS